MNKRRKGQALVEFALVGFALTALLMGIIGIGTMLIQSTATASASISASMIFDLQVEKEDVNNVEEVYAALRTLNLYNDAHLILEPADYFAETFNGGPLASLNRRMLPLYQFDRDRNVYRYPGAPASYNNGNAVLIPRTARDTSETITAWYRPVEIEFDPNVTDQTVLNVTLNMASQPATLLSYPTDALGRTVGLPLVADDGTVNVQANLPDGFNLQGAGVVNSPFASTNRGQFGLGEMKNFGTNVRPFRRVFFHRGTFRLKPVEEQNGTQP